MTPERQSPQRYLRVQPEREASPADLRGTDGLESLSTPSSASTFVFTESVVRAGWSMRLHALLGEEVARAVRADILTVAEAEVLLARLAVVIDQAVGASEN